MIKSFLGPDTMQDLIGQGLRPPWICKMFETLQYLIPRVTTPPRDPIPRGIIPFRMRCWGALPPLITQNNLVLKDLRLRNIVWALILAGPASTRFSDPKGQYGLLFPGNDSRISGSQIPQWFLRPAEFPQRGLKASDTFKMKFDFLVIGGGIVLTSVTALKNLKIPGNLKI